MHPYFDPVERAKKSFLGDRIGREALALGLDGAVPFGRQQLGRAGGDERVEVLE